MDRKTGDDTRLTYCTTGVLLEILVNRRDMRSYTHIVLDEVHERDQESDFCLLLVNMLLRKNSRDVKVSTQLCAWCAVVAAIMRMRVRKLQLFGFGIVTGISNKLRTPFSTICNFSTFSTHVRLKWLEACRKIRKCTIHVLTRVL